MNLFKGSLQNHRRGTVAVNPLWSHKTRTCTLQLTSHRRPSTKIAANRRTFNSERFYSVHTSSPVASICSRNVFPDSLRLCLLACWLLTVINNHTCFHGSSEQAVRRARSRARRGGEGVREKGREDYWRFHQHHKRRRGSGSGKEEGSGAGSSCTQREEAGLPPPPWLVDEDGTICIPRDGRAIRGEGVGRGFGPVCSAMMS